jgi:hypothetical protein
VQQKIPFIVRFSRPYGTLSNSAVPATEVTGYFRSSLRDCGLGCSLETPLCRYHPETYAAPLGLTLISKPTQGLRPGLLYSALPGWLIASGSSLLFP